MPHGREILLGLSGLGGGVCLVSGLRYDAAGSREPFADFILTLGVLGATGLVAIGLLQWRAAARPRFTLLIVQAVVGAAYAAANAFGRVVGPHLVGGERDPARLHDLGLVLGFLLFLAVVVEAFFVSRAEG